MDYRTLTCETCFDGNLDCKECIAEHQKMENEEKKFKKDHETLIDQIYCGCCRDDDAPGYRD